MFAVKIKLKNKNKKGKVMLSHTPKVCDYWSLFQLH